MKWELLLSYGKKLYLDDKEKEELEKQLDSGATDILIGRQRINASIIKGIFRWDEQGQQDDMRVADLHLQEQNRVFNEDCSLWQKKSPEDKAKREMKIRVVPFWKLNGGKREDKIMRVIYEWIIWWFKKNPSYPRCPVWFWGGFLEIVFKKKDWGHFATIIRRNDGVVDEWVKYHRLLT